MLPAVEPLYSLAKGAFYPGLRWGLKWTVEGAERIPREGPAILASNHVSYLDPLTLAWLADRRGRRVRFLAKAELFDKPALGWALRSVHQIPVRRGSQDAATSLDAAVDALRAGECVSVFPEGTISLDLEPMPGKSGTARLAQASGVGVTPVGLWGTHRILFKGRKPRWRWGIAQTAVVGEPVNVGPDEDIRDATNRIMAAICACVARAREIYPQRPVPGDEWWWREPDSAVPRSCRAAGPTQAENTDEIGAS
jgi:1-acyl-sn-glycerol-3-phosphate acyltransferase